MRNRILVVLLAVVITGCVMNKTQAEQALKDTITLNLVKQSAMDMWGTPISGYTLNSYNGCSAFSRFNLYVQVLAAINPKIYRPISCDALDLRLNNKGWYDISASSLVGYYMDQLANQYATIQIQAETNQKEALKLQIENMANGK